MTYLMRKAETDERNLDYSVMFPVDLSQTVKVDLLNPISQNISWLPFEWREIDCPLDAYLISCIDENEA